MSSVVKSTHTEEPPKVKRKTLSVASLSHLRQSSRNVVGDCSADRPSWLDAYVCPPPLRAATRSFPFMIILDYFFNYALCTYIV
jgi:hypothetical protein